MPKGRNADFYPNTLERGLRSGIVVCMARRCLSPTTSTASRPPSRPCFQACPGSAVSSTSSATPKTHVPCKAVIPEIHDDLRAVYNAPNRAEADRLLHLAIAEYEKPAPKLAAWMADAVPEGVTAPVDWTPCRWCAAAASARSRPA